MKLPILQEMNASREWLDTFRGYNHNLKIGEGEFYEMTNLSLLHALREVHTVMKILECRLSLKDLLRRMRFVTLTEAIS